MTIDIPLHDTIYIIQALQVVPLVIIAIWGGIVLLKKEKLTPKVVLIFWSLFSASVLAAAIVCSLATFNYVHNDRPIYQAENAHFSNR